MKLFEAGKPILKGNLHCHTTLSDGRLSPDEVIKLYHAHGYDFLALTDHWHVNEPGRYQDMAVLSGVELDVNLPREAVHIVGVGMDGDLLGDLRGRAAPQVYVDAVNRHGGAAILCHPAWSLNAPETMCALRNVTATEIYNSFSGVPWNSGRADASAHVDLAAARGWTSGLVASDDSHRYTGEAGMSYTCVQADDRSGEAILAGLKRGAYYASQGPAFEQIEYADGALTVKCSPVAYVVFYSNLVWVRDRCRAGKDMTEAVYETQQAAGETYVRCELIDRFGRRAWSSPILY